MTDLNIQPKDQPFTCWVVGCLRPIRARHLCTKHYQVARYSGTPMTLDQLPPLGGRRPFPSTVNRPSRAWRKGFRFDVQIAKANTLFGSVVTCTQCTNEPGWPEWSALIRNELEARVVCAEHRAMHGWTPNRYQRGIAQ